MFSAGTLMFIDDGWFLVQKPLTLDWVFITVIYRSPQNGLTVYHDAQDPSTDGSSSPAYGKFRISYPVHSHYPPSNRLAVADQGFPKGFSQKTAWRFWPRRNPHWSIAETQQSTETKNWRRYPGLWSICLNARLICCFQSFFISTSDIEQRIQKLMLLSTPPPPCPGSLNVS